MASDSVPAKGTGVVLSHPRPDALTMEHVPALQLDRLLVVVALQTNRTETAVLDYH